LHVLCALDVYRGKDAIFSPMHVLFCVHKITEKVTNWFRWNFSGRVGQLVRRTGLWSERIYDI